VVSADGDPLGAAVNAAARITGRAEGGTVVVSGAMVVWSPYLAGRDPGVWVDPLQFNPGRYGQLNESQATQADNAWVPFGRGPHMCIGFALAQMELSLMLARFAQRLDLTPTATTVPAPTGLVVNGPSGGTPFRVALRAREISAR
jgi:hypothetical protein